MKHIETQIVRGITVKDAVKILPFKVIKCIDAGQFFRKLDKEGIKYSNKKQREFVCEEFLKYHKAWKPGYVGYITHRWRTLSCRCKSQSIVTYNKNTKHKLENGYIVYNQNNQIVEFIYDIKLCDLISYLRKKLKVDTLSTYKVMKIKTRDRETPTLSFSRKNINEDKLGEYDIFYCVDD